MAGKDILVMTRKEAKRLHVIRKVMEGEISQIAAAEMLSLSARQVRRITERIHEEGDEGIIHRHRGMVSNRKTAGRTKDKIVRLYRKHYEGFGPTLAAEKLQELNGISISDETLRLWLIDSGDWKKRKKRGSYRKWRPRRSHYGEMIQIDGSHHDWFEGRGPKCVLMGYIDDATGEVFGRFYEYEGTMPAMDSFMKYTKKYGLPLSVYLDRHTTYKSPKKEESDEEYLSQFERAMAELQVEVIHAYSPQAKGRVERLFGTLQDRLVKEMRLKGIKSIEEANVFLETYLPVYNNRFSVEPKEKADVHRSIKGLNLKSILSVKTERKLNNDWTVAYGSKFYQIEEKIKASEVIVEERLDGTMVITHNEVSLKYTELPQRPEKQKKVHIPKKKSKRTLPADHPWRKMKNRPWSRSTWALARSG
ncbi:MAG: ISNCY family transposase [Nitrospiraceae bacterium]|nr:ISNCY family transposase [Nitrospiraceae bacterium]